MKNYGLTESSFPSDVVHKYAHISCLTRDIPCTYDCDGDGLGCSDDECVTQLSYDLLVYEDPRDFTAYFQGAIRACNDDVGFCKVYNVGRGTLSSIAEVWEDIGHRIDSGEAFTLA